MNNKFLLVILAMVFSYGSFAQNKMGNNPTIIDTNSVLELESLTRGFVLPRMTTVQMNAIPAGAFNGMLIFNTTANCVFQKRSGSWVSMCSISRDSLMNFITNNNTIRDSIISLINSLGKPLKGTGIIVTGGDSAVLRATSLRLDSSYIAVMTTQSPVRDSILSLISKAGVSMPIRVVTASTVIAPNDYTVLANCTAGGLTFTIPSPVGNYGKIYILGKADNTGNVLTFSSSVRMLVGTTFSTLNYNRIFTIQSDGTDWWVIGQQ